MDAYKYFIKTDYYLPLCRCYIHMHKHFISTEIASLQKLNKIFILYLHLIFLSYSITYGKHQNPFQWYHHSCPHLETTTHFLSLAFIDSENKALKWEMYGYRWAIKFI